MKKRKQKGCAEDRPAESRLSNITVGQMLDNLIFFGSSEYLSGIDFQKVLSIRSDDSQISCKVIFSRQSQVFFEPVPALFHSLNGYIQ